MIGQTISHYRILAKIGEGGMGEVYLAEDIELHRNVAIKFLPTGYATDPDALSRFKREARAAAALNHPNIITIHEVAEHEGRPFIVMAHVEGHPLPTAIAGRVLALDRALDYAIQVADGLAKAHQAGVVHRDIKPDNLLVDADGHVKILDFGLAKLHGATKLTREASTVGTLHYMSPEQTRGSDVDHRSDIFSLGAVLYEMVTGQLAFHGDHAAAVAYSVAAEEPQPLARFNNQATPELQRIVSKALAKDPAERYQSAADLGADLRRERGRSQASRPPLEPASPGASVPPSSAPQRRAMRFIVPSAIVFAAVVAVLIFKPFRIEVGSDHPVVAAGNTLAVMYFDNIVDPADPKRQGEIMTNLLITNLSESSGLEVLSSQRLYDLLRLVGKEEVKSVDRATATAVAQKAEVRWMLLGSILQVEPVMVVTSQLVDVASGAVASSERVTSEGGESVFDLADRLTDEIKEDMSVPTGLAARGETPAMRVTQSEEAYRYYLEGREYQNRYLLRDAVRSFHKAIEVDSTFALAYRWLASPYFPTSQPEKLEYIEKALAYSNHLPERDRLSMQVTNAFLHKERKKALDLLHHIVDLYPDDKEAYTILGSITGGSGGDDETAIRYFRRAIEIDPMYQPAYNQLAYACDNVGDLDQSIWAINKYIEIAPDEPNPYDTRGDIYARHGKLDEAIASYKKALEKKSDFGPSIAKLGHMYRAKRDYATAESYYHRLIEVGEADGRSNARLLLAAIPAYQGKLVRALELLGQGLAADRLDDYDGEGYRNKLRLEANIYELRGDLDKAVATAVQLPRFETWIDGGWDRVYCEILAKSGDIEGAERAAASMRQRIDSGDASLETSYQYAVGWISFARGNFDDAATHFEMSVELFPRTSVGCALALSYLKGKRFAESVDTFNRFLERYDYSRAVQPTVAATMHYWTGVGYESAGSTDRAVEHYQEFLTLWKDADPGLQIVNDAKRRLERLRQGS